MECRHDILKKETKKMKDPIKYAKLLKQRTMLEELIEEYGPNQELTDVIQDIKFQIKNIK